MSRFDDMFARRAVPHLKLHMGCRVTYIPSAGDVVQLTALISPENSTQQENEAGQVDLVRTRSVTISSDASDGIVKPLLSDQVKFGGETWAIVAVTVKAGGTHQLECVKRQVRRLTRDNYVRGNR